MRNSTRSLFALVLLTLPAKAGENDVTTTDMMGLLPKPGVRVACKSKMLVVGMMVIGPEDPKVKSALAEALSDNECVEIPGAEKINILGEDAELDMFRIIRDNVVMWTKSINRN